MSSTSSVVKSLPYLFCRAKYEGECHPPSRWLRRHCVFQGRCDSRHTWAPWRWAWGDVDQFDRLWGVSWNRQTGSLSMGCLMHTSNLSWLPRYCQKCLPNMLKRMGLGFLCCLIKVVAIQATMTRSDHCKHMLTDSCFALLSENATPRAELKLTRVFWLFIDIN